MFVAHEQEAKMRETASLFEASLIGRIRSGRYGSDEFYCAFTNLKPGCHAILTISISAALAEQGSEIDRQSHRFVSLVAQAFK